MKRKLAVIGSILALLLSVGGGLAWASIPDSSGVIHACYQSPPPAHGANLQVIDTGAGGSCSGGMVPLTWNQTGPQGPPGPAGVSGYQVVTNLNTNASFTNSVSGLVFSESVTCPSGKVPLGGGASFTEGSGIYAGNPAGTVLISDISGNGWTATWAPAPNSSIYSPPFDAEVDVVCANISA